MRKLFPLLLLGLLAGLTLPLSAAAVDLTTPEAQYLSDARSQTLLEHVSQLNLAYAQLAAAGAALFLLCNLRSLAFHCLIGYGVAILNVPYYIPAKFKFICGGAVLLLAAVGLLTRLLLLKPREKVAKVSVEPPAA